MKTCKDCKSEGRTGKPLNIVYLKSGKPAPGPRCFRHHQVHKKAQRKAAADRRRAIIYGIEPWRYQALLEAQGGGCAICGRKPPKRGRQLAVDHDHTCCPGKESCGNCIRGLLCWTDNKWLEHIRDDPEVAQRAVNYLLHPPAVLVAVA